jgi:hypothetical protein
MTGCSWLASMSTSITWPPAYETGLEAGHKAATAIGIVQQEKDPLWLPS